MTKDDIQAEFDDFFEFDTDDRDYVTSVSCRLFAQRIAALTEARVRKTIADELDRNYLVIRCQSPRVRKTIADELALLERTYAHKPPINGT